MPKDAKNKKSSTTGTSERGGRAKAGSESAGPSAGANLRAFLKFVSVLALVGGCVWGYLRTRDHVANQLAFRKDAPRIVLKDRPAWMSDGVAAKIIAVAQPDVAHSAFDHQLLVNTASLLRNHPDTSPWVRQVKSVRRAYDKAPGDVIEIDCDYRAPVALVRFGEYFWLIDGDAVLLPEQYTPADVRRVMYDSTGKLSLRVVEGVATAPPESGQRWRGEDLAAGVEMVRLLHGRSSAEEVERVNVSNFQGRIDRREAQLVLVTRYQTQVRWGRPVGAKDFFVEVTPAQKLKYMEELVAKFGRVDGRLPAVDLRFDVVTFPSAMMTETDGGRQ